MHLRGLLKLFTTMTKDVSDYQDYLELLHFLRVKYINLSDYLGSKVVVIQEKACKILYFDAAGRKISAEGKPEILPYKKAKLMFLSHFQTLDNNFCGNFRVGDAVKLRKSVKKYHKCPEGREDNKTAVIDTFLPDMASGALRTVEDLEGCQYWNVDDVVLVK